MVSIETSIRTSALAMDEARFVADTYKILDILSAMTNKIRMLQMINC